MSFLLTAGVSLDMKPLPFTLVLANPPVLPIAEGFSFFFIVGCGLYFMRFSTTLSTAPYCSQFEYGKTFFAYF